MAEKKLKFKAGQVVYVFGDDVYDCILSVNPSNKWPYQMKGESGGITHSEDDLRALTKKEMGRG